MVPDAGFKPGFPPKADKKILIYHDRRSIITSFPNKKVYFFRFSNKKVQFFKLRLCPRTDFPDPSPPPTPNKTVQNYFKVCKISLSLHKYAKLSYTCSCHLHTLCSIHPARLGYTRAPAKTCNPANYIPLSA